MSIAPNFSVKTSIKLSLSPDPLFPGATLGPTGISVTIDGPLGSSPGAGLYGGVDICVIESCPL